MRLDEKGRLFGRISIIDIFIIVAVIVLIGGYVFNRTSQDIQRVINPDTPIYLTVRVNGVRDFSLRAVEEGDIIFRQHERVPLGTVVSVEYEPAYSLAIRTDGTALMAPMEGRYTMYITISCIGSVTSTGYFVNGTLQMSVGGGLTIQSNQFFATATITDVREG